MFATKQKGKAMYISEQGNEKLGKNVVVVNRPVELTCPPDCPFLHFGCYAEKTENRFKDARRVSYENLALTVEEIQEIIRIAVSKEKDVRMHERGDFLQNGKADQTYIGNWRKAIAASPDLPYIWGYTHAYQKSIANLQQKNVNIYASVHNEEDVKKAKQKGFKLFAWAIDTPKKRGGSKDFPAKVELPVIGKTLVCPEQRLGRDKVTCDKCRWCVEGKGNVVFLKS